MCNATCVQGGAFSRTTCGVYTHCTCIRELTHAQIPSSSSLQLKPKLYVCICMQKGLGQNMSVAQADRLKLNICGSNRYRLLPQSGVGEQGGSHIPMKKCFLPLVNGKSAHFIFHSGAWHALRVSKSMFECH